MIESDKLMMAAKYNDVTTVELLLKYGANIDAQDIEHNTPLHYAAWNGYTKIVELLFKYGANISIPNIEYKTPLYVAAWNGYTETAELLLKYGANLEAEDGEYDMFSSLCL